MSYLLIDLRHCKLQMQLTAHVLAKEGTSTDIERASDADIARKETEFDHLGLASNELLGLLRSTPSALLFPCQLNNKEVIC